MSRSDLMPTLMLAVSLAPAGFLRADTIYQTNAQGRDVVIQRDAIVVKDDSSSLQYKHFELKERRVVKVRLNKGTLPYTVDASSTEERRQIVDNWKRFGYRAVIRDQAGRSTPVADAYLDFYPPDGRGSLLDSVPPRTTLPLLLEQGGADEVDFSEIDRIEFQGDRVKLTLRKKQVEEGRFLSPTDRPAEARFLGITDKYDPASEQVFDFSIPLKQVKEIRFEEQ